MIEPAPRDDRNEADAGFALVTVLVFLLLASSITTSFALAAHLYLRQAVNERDDRINRSDLMLLMHVGAIVHRGNGPRATIWETPWLQCSFALEDGREITARYINHAGLIDLNAAQEDLLALGFAALGLTPDMANRLAEGVQSFRSANRMNNTFLGDSDNLPADGGKGAPFEAVAELLDFPVAGQVDLDALRTVFTVHAQTATIDRLRASPVLRAYLDRIGSTNAGQQIVSSGRREPAVTLDVLITRQGRPKRTGRLVFSANEAPGVYRLLEPPEFGFAVTRPPGFDQFRSDPQCAAYFNPVTLAGINALLT